jgi:hypothetical protein
MPLVWEIMAFGFDGIVMIVENYPSSMRDLVAETAVSLLIRQVLALMRTVGQNQQI